MSISKPAMSPAGERATRQRVLVVDDSAFMRRLVSDVIAEDGAFDVVGTARDGVHALAQIHALNPDIVTLDIEMPGQDGLITLEQIMATTPRPVVMLSAGGADGGAEATLRALELGAVDFVRKPSGAISLDLDTVREQLLETLRAAACINRDSLLPSRRAGAVGERREPAAISTALNTMREASRRDAPATRIVCIASSTGGPAALSQVIPRLPYLDDTAVVIVQHMPVGFTESLARRLNAVSAMTVREAVDRESLRGGCVYVAPGGMHLRVVGSSGQARFRLDDAAPLWGVRPAADYLFVSAATIFGADTVGVVLTGMGCDGADGLFAIRHAGGRGIVQDAESSVIAGMPNAALRHAGADHVVALGDIAGTIETVTRPRATSGSGSVVAPRVDSGHLPRNSHQ